MNFGIAAIFDSEIANRIIRIQEELNEKWTFEFKLGSHVNVPHMSILQGTLPNTELAIAPLDFVVKQFGKNIRSLSFERALYREKGWYFLGVVKQPWMLDLQDKILELLASYLVVDEKDKKKDISMYTEAEKMNFLKYGYRYIGDSFSPHITIGRRQNDSLEQRHNDLLAKINSEFQDCMFPVAGFTVYIPGRSGEHQYAIHTINF